MRRVMLFALLALALPTVVSATSFISSGTFIQGTPPCPGFLCHSWVSRNSSGGFSSGAFEVEVTGTMNSIDLRTNPLFPPETGLTIGCVNGTLATGMCTFGEGIVRISPGTPNVMTFPIDDGVITRTTTSAVLTAMLDPVPSGLGPGVTFKIGFAGPPSNSSQLLSGIALVGTPEPGTLVLLGTSVIGLAGMARRRLRLGK